MFGYFEEKRASKIFKEAYVSGINTFISDGYRHQEEARTAYIAGIARDPEKYRSDLRNMLGFPLNDQQSMNSQTSLSKVLLFEDDEKVIYRTTVTVLDAIPFTGLLFLHKDTNPRPFIIVQHGGSGTPELCSGFFNNRTANYNNMTERVFLRGANVFAPQLLLWSDDYETDGFKRSDRIILDGQLKQLGGSIASLEIFCIIKSIDALCTVGYADAQHLGMIGFSYGGFYTLFTTAIEKRLKAAFSCSFFNKRSHYPWLDWTWMGSAGKFLDAEAAMLIYPRCLRIAVGDNDELFNAKLAVEEFDRLRKLSHDIYGNTDWFDTCIFPGTHEFIKTDDFIEKVIAEVSK